MKVGILLVLVCFVAGCVSQSVFRQAGSTSDAAGCAKISCDSERKHKVMVGLDQKVFISAVDGKSTFTMSAFSDAAPYAQIAYVKPGRRYLDLRYTHMNGYANGKVWLDAEAGKSYVVRKKVVGYAISFWVEEEDTHRVVGGLPGGEPEKNVPADPK